VIHHSQNQHFHSHDTHTTLQTQLEEYGFTSSKTRPVLPSGTPFTISFPRQIPSMLHTCRESAEYMRFQGRIRILATPISPPICVNPAVDRVLFTFDSEGKWRGWDHSNGVLPHFSASEVELVMSKAPDA
jgi:hypothetical protein